MLSIKPKIFTSVKADTTCAVFAKSAYWNTWVDVCENQNFTAVFKRAYRRAIRGGF